MVQWIKSEVRRVVSEALVPVVAGAGFRFKKSSQAFVRKIDGGRQELGLALADYNPVFEFSFTLCVRLEAVQEIVNRFSGSPPKYHGETLTSITQLEFLGLPAQPGRGVVYRVESESQLLEILPSIAEIVRQRALPFFNEYRDVEALNRGLNPAGAERVLEAVSDRHLFDATNQPYRSMTGVTVAHLARDARLAELIAAYRSQLRESRESVRQKFEELVAYLRQHAAGERDRASKPLH